MTIKVALSRGSVIAGKAQTLSTLWQQLASQTIPTSDLPCEAFESWPWGQVRLADEPKAAELSVCRKTLRTMEKQAKLILHGAQLANQQASIEYVPATTGLYLAIPTVDEAVPPWPLLEAMDEYQYTVDDTDRWLTGEFLTREIPAFFGLSTLNSNTCAYISAQFNLTGEMAAYSTFADAALHAVIDGCLSIAEGTNSHALIGSVAPKINPLLLLQYDYQQYQGTFANSPAEGSAFIWAENDSLESKAVLSGYARGFVAQGDKTASINTLIDRALSMAGISFSDVDWFLCAGIDEEKHGITARAEDKDHILFDAYSAIGNAGAATPLIALNMAIMAIEQGQKLASDKNGVGLSEINADVRHVALSAVGPEGQYVVVIISRSEP